MGSNSYPLHPSGTVEDSWGCVYMVLLRGLAAWPFNQHGCQKRSQLDLAWPIQLSGATCDTLPFLATFAPECCDAQSAQLTCTLFICGGDEINGNNLSLFLARSFASLESLGLCSLLLPLDTFAFRSWDQSDSKTSPPSCFDIRWTFEIKIIVILDLVLRSECVHASLSFLFFFNSHWERSGGNI
ncbi:Hypothetical predicted protein [Podarcis lilfordi]|uniref:Uncharacterized protein n=1 Tax=Podarcis lilfordi TaxID=74358 RepID=A0AA35PT85_9SAUR|nr:Hypothetical predicted protein [Podarcis lilfordi]